MSLFGSWWYRKRLATKEIGVLLGFSVRFFSSVFGIYEAKTKLENPLPCPPMSPRGPDGAALPLPTSPRGPMELPSPHPQVHGAPMELPSPTHKSTGPLWSCHPPTYESTGPWWSCPPHLQSHICFMLKWPQLQPCSVGRWSISTPPSQNQGANDMSLSLISTYF